MSAIRERRRIKTGIELTQCEHTGEKHRISIFNFVFQFLTRALGLITKELQKRDEICIVKQSWSNCGLNDHDIRSCLAGSLEESQSMREDKKLY